MGKDGNWVSACSGQLFWVMGGEGPSVRRAITPIFPRENAPHAYLLLTIETRCCDQVSTSLPIVDRARLLSRMHGAPRSLPHQLLVLLWLWLQLLRDVLVRRLLGAVVERCLPGHGQMLRNR